jgi:hypothetical protein
MSGNGSRGLELADSLTKCRCERADACTRVEQDVFIGNRSEKRSHESGDFGRCEYLSSIFPVFSANAILKSLLKFLGIHQHNGILSLEQTADVYTQGHFVFTDLHLNRGILSHLTITPPLPDAPDGSSSSIVWNCKWGKFIQKFSLRLSYPS